MKVLAYFRELLRTLHAIEQHLATLAGCVRPHPFKRYSGNHIRTGHWNDES